MTFDTPTTTELAQIVKDTGLSSREFGEAVGYSDAERTARALLKGERHQKPYAMSGTAVHSLRYMLALHKIASAHSVYQVDMNPDTKSRLANALAEAIAILPKRLQP